MVVAYFVTSIAMVFLNKVLMDPAVTGDFPFFLVMCQAICTGGICYLLGLFGHKAKPGSFLSTFPKLTVDPEIMRAVFPLSLVFTGMIAFNQLCLAYVEVSFYNVARSLTIVFNVIFTYWLLGETTSRKTLLTLLVVIAGFFIGSGTEVHFSLIGTFFGVLSSVFVSLNSIYTKKSMAVVQGNQWALALYNNINATIIFAILCVVLGEPQKLWASDAIITVQFWLLLLLSGVTGFGIGILTILQIKVTSPLTHNISGTAKAGVQTILALFIWQNPTTAMNLFGTFLVLIGSFLYALERSKEMDARRASSSSTALATNKASSTSQEDGREGPREASDDVESETAELITGTASQPTTPRAATPASARRRTQPDVAVLSGGGSGVAPSLQAGSSS